jgi:hypothetical protein
VKDPTDEPCELIVHLNAAASQDIPLKPLSETQEGMMMMTTSGLSSLYVSNPGTVAMELRVVAAGD